MKISIRFPKVTELLCILATFALKPVVQGLYADDEVLFLVDEEVIELVKVLTCNRIRSE